MSDPQPLSDDDYEKEIERARTQGAIEALERFLEEVDSLCLDGGWAYTGEAEELLDEYRKKLEEPE